MSNSDSYRNFNKYNEVNDEVTLREIIVSMKNTVGQLLNRWLIILIASFSFGLIGLGYALYTSPKYIATTSFVLEEGEKGGGLGSLGGLASLAGIDLGGGAGGLFSGDNIFDLYKSRLMIERTLLTKLNHQENSPLLIDSYIQSNNLKKKWKKVQWERVDFQRSDSETVLKDSITGEIVKSILKNNLSVFKPDKKVGTIKVIYKSEDQVFAKVFSDALVSAVNDYYIQIKTEKSKRNVEILQQKTDSVRAVMVKDIYRAAEVSDATLNSNPARQAKRGGPMQTAQFSAEANKIVLSELVKNLELAKLTLMKETPLIQLIDQPKFPLEVVKVGKAKGLIVGGILGFFLCSIYIIISNYLKRTSKYGQL